MRFATRIAAWIPAVAALLFALMVAGPGVPALRQDWVWPADRGGLHDLFVRSTSGWDPVGIGGPNLYLNDYLIGAATSALIAVLGAHLALFAFIAAIAAACALGGAAMARTFGAGPVGAAAVGLFALCNPWVYAEIVAGHTYMLLAYGALMALVAECRRDRPRPLVAALIAVLTLQQLQFFAVALVFTAISFRRIGWIPVISALIAGAPAAAAAVLEAPAYRAVPFTLAWETVQSVNPIPAILLSGYYAGYTQFVDRVDMYVVAIVAGVAAFGLVTIARTRWGAAASIGAVVFVVCAMGLHGPLAAIDRAAMQFRPGALLFRELFDVLGFAAICYAIGLSAASARRAVFAAIVLVLGIGLAVPWAIWSPWSWWVPASALSSPTVAADPGSRYALVPSFQPLSVARDGSGSGADPDAILRAHDVSPVNERFPQYPVDAALARYDRSGDASSLEALGVSAVIVRPWLASDAADPGQVRPSHSRGDGAAVRLTPLPPLAVEPDPLECAICTDLAGDAEFFGDRDPSSIVSIDAPDRFVHAADGWVDARLAFAADPDLAQPFGGAMTTNAEEALPVRGGMSALAYVKGALLADDGAIVASTSPGYRWISIPQGASAVRCRGLCVVAVEATSVPAVPDEGPRVRARALDLDELRPWKLIADLPRGPAGVARFDVRYDPHWQATLEGVRLNHVRIDAALNGWLLPARRDGEQVEIVQGATQLEAALELVGGFWVAGLVAVAASSAARRRRATASAP